MHLGAHPKATSFAYCNGRSIIIRDLKNPAIATEFTAHPYATTVARFSPSGFYMASGDERGFVRVFDPSHPDQMIKSEFQILSGEIHDLAWDSESKRIVAVGNGKDRFGHAFTFDSGNSIGEISGHNKAALTVAIRPVRPFRAATGSEDMTMNFYTAVPFKFSHSNTDHSRFVTCVQFSFDGKYLLSASTDGKWQCYDGATGEKTYEVANAHRGGIYSISCSPNTHRMISSSADGTVKLWDMTTQQLVNTWTVGTGVSNQQLGNLWAGEWLLSVSLDGQLNYLDERSEKIARTVYGHQKSISTMALHGTNVYTGCFEGRLMKWEEDGSNFKLTGEPHSNKVVEIVSTQSQLLSVGMDDQLKTIDAASFSVTDTTKLPGLPSSLTTTQQATVIASSAGLIVNGKDYPEVPATVVAASANHLARAHETKVYLHALPFQVDPLHTLVPSHHQVSALSFSSSRLAVGDAAGGIHVFDFEGTLCFQWLGHTSRIMSIQFSASEQHAVSASLDTSIRIWNMDHQKEPLAIKNAHISGVTNVCFHPKSDKSVISSGMDGCIKSWSIVSLP